MFQLECYMTQKKYYSFTKKINSHLYICLENKQIIINKTISRLQENVNKIKKQQIIWTQKDINDTRQ